MTKLSTKTLLIILAFLLIPTILLIQANRKAGLVSAGWFDDGWHYRKAVNVTNSVGTTLTDFQVSISIGTSALISQGKMQSDCDDLRITDANGKVLSYWLSGCNTDTTQIWPKIPNIPISGATVYVYYGNPSATSGKSVVGTSDYPGLSCKSILDAGNSTGIGNYWIDPTNGNTSDKFQVYCDMTNDSGGWMLVTESMINSEIGSSVTTTKTTNANGGVDITNTINNSGSCSGTNYYKVYINDIIPWSKIKADYEFLGGNSCWAIFGNTGSSAGTNLIEFASATDTIRNQIKMGGSAGDNYDGINTRCDNYTYNFWHSNQGVGTTRSSQTILRRNSMAAIAGIGTGTACVSNNYPWKYKNIYIREDVMTFSVTATPATEEISKAPVAYWSFDEGQGTTVNDSSSNSNDGTLGAGTSAPSWQTEEMCVSGKCLKFDGSNYLDMGASSSLSFQANDDFTISAWVKPTSNDTGTLISTEGQNEQGYNLIYANDKITFSVGGMLENSLSYFLDSKNSNSFVPHGATWYDLSGNGNNGNLSNIVYDGNGDMYYDGTGTSDGLTAGSHVTLPSFTTARNDSGTTISWWMKQDDTIRRALFYGSSTLNHLETNITYLRGETTTNGNMWDSPSHTIGSDWVFYSAVWDGNNVLWYRNNSFLGTKTGISNDFTMSKIGRSTGTTTYLYAPSFKGYVPVFIKHNTKLSSTQITQIYQSSAYRYNLASENTSSQTIETNKFNLITAKKEGTTCSIYINAKLSKTFTCDLSENLEGNLSIGQRASGVREPFNGFIDEVKIYPYARSAREIKSDYNAGKAGASSSKGTSASLGGSSLTDSLSNGLVGYWKMDEASWNGTAGEVVDFSGNSNHGVGVGATKPTTGAGKFGNGGVFDGASQYVNVLDPAGGSLDFTSTQNLTISAWLNYSDTAGTNYLLAKGDTLWGTGNNGPGYIINYFEDNGTIYFRAGDSSSRKECSYAVELNNSSWNHLVFILNRQSNLIKGYLNGAEICSTSAAGLGDLSNAYALTLGSYSNAGAGSHWQGSLDEVRIYNRALSPAEVADLYNWAPGPVAYYNFNEGVGSSAFDTSGYGNNGGWNGTGTHWGTGKFGKAGKFNGSNDYVEMGDLLALADESLVATYCFWAKGLGHLISTERPNGITHVGSGNIIINSDGSIKYFSYDISPSPFGHGITSTATADINQWNFYCVVMNGPNDSYKLVVNSAIEDKSLSLATITGRTSTELGRWHNSTYGTSYFNGLIDEVKIYNYARTQKQIVQDMNAGHPNVGSPVGSALAHYKFDEGYGTTTNNSGNGGSSLNGAMGTGNSAPSWSQNGKFEKALSFDGNDYVDYGNPSALNTTLITASAWIKPSTVSGSSAPIAKASGGGDMSWEVYQANSNIYFYVNNGTSYNHADATSTLTINQWTHVVGTWDGSTIKIYFNGKLEGQTSFIGTLKQTAFNIYTGRRTDGYFFSGLIDDVKIYNYALTEDEVKTDYNQGKSTVMGSLSSGTGNTAPSNAASQEYCIPGDSTYCSPPVAEWNLNEGIGGNAYDTSGNNNTGTLGAGNSAPTWTTGKIGKGLRFDGSNDYVDAGSCLYMATFTLEAWIKAGTDVSNYRTIISREASSTDRNYWLDILQTSGLLDFRISIGNVGKTFTSTRAINDNVWHHVVATYDNSYVNLYVDGVSVMTPAAQTGAPDNPAVNCIIGQSGSAYQRYFNGLIDQVRIYNYARTPAQIAWDYNRGAPIAHYKLDECEGTTVHDSINGLNGAINIGASGTQNTTGTCAASNAAAAWYNGATGKYNSSLNFDGTDDYVGNINIGSTLSNVTISAWIYVNSSTGTWQVPLAVGSNPTINIACETADNQKCGCDLYNAATNPKDIGYNTWTLITCVKDGSGMTQYINGKYSAYESVSNSITNPTVNIGRGRASEYYTKGQIDDVKIFNYALTGDQIKTLFNGGAVSFR